MIHPKEKKKKKKKKEELESEILNKECTENSESARNFKYVFLVNPDQVWSAVCKLPVSFLQTLTLICTSELYQNFSFIMCGAVFSKVCGNGL